MVLKLDEYPLCLPCPSDGFLVGMIQVPRLRLLSLNDSCINNIKVIMVHAVLLVRPRVSTFPKIRHKLIMSILAHRLDLQELL